MRTQPDADARRRLPTGSNGPLRTTLMASLLLTTVLRLSAQVPFERAVAELSSPDASVRLRAATLLKQSPLVDAALPLAKAVGDPDDEVQLQAIAAELNIFLAEPIVPRKRVGFVVEVRNRIAAEEAFSDGPLALGATIVPIGVLDRLRAAARDQNPRVGVEALYAFGALASAPIDESRGELRRKAGPDVAAITGSVDPTLRLAAIRVVGRLFEWHPGDAPVDPYVGDTIISMLNDRERALKLAAMDTLGAMRYARSVEALTQLFEYRKRGELADAAFDALGRIAHTASVPLFMAQLTNSNPARRAIAIEGLARNDARAHADDIQKALASEHNEGVVLAGAFASSLMTNAPSDQLVDALKRPRLRDQAIRYLIEIAPGRTSAFARYAQDPDAALRADTADILGLAGDPAGVQILEPLTADSSKHVTFVATRALVRLRASKQAP